MFDMRVRFSSDIYTYLHYVTFQQLLQSSQCLSYLLGCEICGLDWNLQPIILIYIIRLVLKYTRGLATP